MATMLAGLLLASLVTMNRCLWLLSAQPTSAGPERSAGLLRDLCLRLLAVASTRGRPSAEHVPMGLGTFAGSAWTVSDGVLIA